MFCRWTTRTTILPSPSLSPDVIPYTYLNLSSKYISGLTKEQFIARRTLETARAKFNSIAEFDEMLASDGGSLAVFERLAMQADLIEGLKFMFQELGDLVNDLGDALWDAGVVGSHRREALQPSLSRT